MKKNMIEYCRWCKKRQPVMQIKKGKEAWICCHMCGAEIREVSSAELAEQKAKLLEHRLRRKGLYDIEFN